MKFSTRLLPLALGAVLLSCAEEEQKVEAPTVDYTKTTPADFTAVKKSKQAPKVTFTDIARSAGINFRHQTGAVDDKWMPETMGSGCALFDYDNDDRLDIYLVNSTYWPGKEKAEPATGKLYRNQGDGTFADVTAQAGLDFSVYAMGANIADYDADGDADIYLTTLGDNLLLRNDAGLFTDVAKEAGVVGQQWRDDSGGAQDEWSTSAAWADVDGDGWLDLFVANYVHWSPSTDIYTSQDGKTKSYATPQQYPGSTCRLYRNKGDGTFEETTQQAGVELPMAKSMGVAMDDFDGDGHIDLVVTNDTQPNFLLQNQGDGTFVERGLAAGIGYDETGRARAGMGVDIAALDNDGVPAIAIGNFSREALSLYRQVQDSFLDVSGKHRLVQSTLPTLTFGLLFRDYDQDGFQDLVLINGHIEPEINNVQREIQYAQPPQLFWNDGESHFIDVSAHVGPLFTSPIIGRGLAAGDIDDDGDLDLLLTTNGGPAYLLRNDGPTGRAISLQLRGKAPNLDAIGAAVSAQSGDLTQRRMVRTGSSYLSHSAPILNFGLGQRAQVDRLHIRWPDGSEEELENLAAGSNYWIEQGKGITRQQAFIKPDKSSL